MREDRHSLFLRLRTAGGLLALAAVIAMGGSGCGSGDQPDPNVVPRPRNLEENRGFISPPTLQNPIYACARSVVVKNFIPGAVLQVFVAGNPVPIGTKQSWLSGGQNVDVSIAFSVGQRITARQVFDGATSDPSNEVTVTSHTEDYPAGLPQPRIELLPLLACGRAIAISDVPPGAVARVFAENPIPPPTGGFAPPVEVGSLSDFPYTFVGPPFVEGARVWAETSLCTDTSPRSAVAIVQATPAALPAPGLDPVHEGVNIATVRGAGGSELGHGATLDVFSSAEPPPNRTGGQPTPGYGGQQVFINPASGTANFWATQTLCTTVSPESPHTPVVPCASLPAARIRAPLPGDTQVEVIEYVPGARILVFANGVEIGDSGPPFVNLSRPVAEGETITVVQRIGSCTSGSAHVLPVSCARGGQPLACSGDWPAFRHDGLRAAEQPVASVLSDPNRVKTLEVKWQFPRAGDPPLRGFRGSPVVWEGRVFVGNADGRFRALDAATGNLLWTFPNPPAAPLLSQYEPVGNPSTWGIASSGAIAFIERRAVVIFGAPDQSVGRRLGSGRLFARDAITGAEVWTSPEIAVMDGLNPGATNELHEQIGYSSPLILGDRVYIGIADHGDSPIQNGRVVAVELATGNIIGAFNYRSTSTRGGGVWSSPAGGLSGAAVYITTGNTNIGGPEPSPNHGLSLLRLDPASGAVSWKHQPVPFALDGDPDWASGPTLMTTSCGERVVSTMKDGWTYAARATATAPPAASVQWQFPPTGFPFTTADMTVHGDSRYLIPGAGWRDIFFTTTGGEEIVTSTTPGFTRLHALEVCAGRRDRVRWIADIPATNPTSFGYELGPPTVTRGIVFIGTSQGHVVALADPSVWPVAGSRCSKPDVSNADCVANGFRLVPIPKVLANVAVADPGHKILGEPVLAGGRLFVASTAHWDPTSGRLYMLAPRD